MKLKDLLPEGWSTPHLDPLETSIKEKLSTLGMVSGVKAYENDANDRVYGTVSFRERVLPDENKIQTLLNQIKGPNSEDLDIQIVPGQTTYEYEKEWDNDRVYWPSFKFTSIKGIY